MNTFTPATLRNGVLSLAICALFAGCGKGSSGGATVDTSSAGSTSTGGAVSQFAPAGGAVSTIPSAVFVSFSETNLDVTGGPNSVLNASNYSLACTIGGVKLPTGVSFSSATAVATVYLPSVAGAGNSCTLSVSGHIEDTNGNLLGATSVSYSVPAATGLSVSQFFPAPGSYSSIPAQFQVRYSSTNLDLSGGANSVVNPANYSLLCGSASYSATSAFYAGSGAVNIAMPSVNQNAGTSCVLSVSANVSDALSHSLGGTASAVYQVSAYGNFWNPSYNGSSTGYAGINPLGTYFGDTGFNSSYPAYSYLLEGLVVSANTAITQVTGQWLTSFNLTGSPASGGAHGAGGGTQSTLLCPAGLRVTGLVGSYDNSQIDSIAILCQSQDQTQTYASASVGGAGAGTYRITCPAGQFATDLMGYAGSAVGELQLGCH